MSVTGPGGTTITVEFSPTTAPLATPSYVDITGDVVFEPGVTIRRGRNSEFDDFTAGRCSFRLRNEDRAYDPNNSAGTYFGNLKPMRRFRVSVAHNSVTYRLFTGFIQGWPQEYDESTRMSYVPVELVDGFEVLAAAKLPESVWEQTIVDHGLNPNLSIVIANWYRLNETAGLVSRGRFNPSGIFTHGQWENVPSAPGTAGLVPFSGDGAARFVDGAVVTIPSVLIEAFTAAVEFWFQTDTADECVLIDAGSSGRTWRVAIEAGQLRYGQTDSSGQATETDDAFNDGEPHHVVINHGHPAEIFVDGVEVDVTASTPPFALFGKNEATIGATRTDGFPFDGVIDEVVFYDTALDAAEVLEHYQAGAAPWDGDTTGERLARVLDLVGWPAGDRDIDTGEVVLGPASLSGSPLAYGKTLEQAEQGRFYIDGQGRVVFKGAHAVLNETESTTSQATFGDGSGSELPYRIGGIGLEQPVDMIVNDVEFSSDSGSVVTVVDDTSQTDYGVRTLKRTVAAPQDAARLENAALYVLGRYKDPQTRLPALSFTPVRVPGAGQTWTAIEMWEAALGLDIAHRVTVVRRPQDVGTEITLTELVEGVQHRFNTKTWDVTLFLSPADTRHYWTWGVSEWGASADPTTRWAY